VPGRRSSLVLASASPRRQELLARLGIPFTVEPSHIPELHPPGPPEAALATVALDKARAVAGRWTAGRAVIIGADTEVVLDGRYMGKPRDAADAVRILSALSGRTHEVITGVALVEAPPGREATAAVTTRVTMTAATREDIAAYVATGEPFDKAGGYAVQGLGARLVARVEGCLTNVVGLPVETTRRLLEAWDLL
jgi:septum formation protein